MFNKSMLPLVLIFLALLHGSGAVPSRVCRADGPVATTPAAGGETQNLMAEIERARGDLDADKLPDLVKTEAEVLRAIARVKSFFEQKTSQSNFEAWMRFLELGPLTDAIAEQASIAERGRAAVSLLSRLRGVDAGLELSAMVSLRDAVKQYIAALRYSDPKRGVASVQKQLDALAELFSPEQDSDSTRPLSDLTPADVARMELLIGGLSDANQADGLVASIRSLYSQPNIRVWVDGPAITEAIMRPVNTQRDLNDCILGTRVIGDSRVDGRVRGQLLPSEGSIRLLVRLDGVFSSSARGYRQPITVDTTGIGNVYAARQLVVTQRKIVLGETIATASLSTRINRINHPLKIVRRIAAKQAAQQKPRAEAISREKLRSQIRQQFDEQTAQVASRRWPDLEEAIDPWFRRLDLPVLNRTFGSTSDAVYARATLRRPAGLAARTPPPLLSSLRLPSGSSVYVGGYLASVQVHQSVLDNTLTPLLAGETFTPRRIERLLATLGLELPAKPASSPPTTSQLATSQSTSTQPQDAKRRTSLHDSDDENFEIDLENFRPVFLEADQQQLRIGLRGTRFAQGDREISRTLEVVATYRPVTSADGTMWLLRDEEVELTFPGTRRLTIGQTAIKANMQRSFNDAFPRELLRRSFAVPATVQLPALAGRGFEVTAIDLTDGWITVAIR